MRKLIRNAWDFFCAEWTEEILNVIFRNDEVGPFDQLLVTFLAVSATGEMGHHISDIYKFHLLTHGYWSGFPKDIFLRLMVISPDANASTFCAQVQRKVRTYLV